jgi:hypothetical protein
LGKAIQETKAGRPWLLQAEEGSKEPVEYWCRSGKSHNDHLQSKVSTFYGPSGTLGVLLMYRRFYKVHGQEETVVNIQVY